MRRIPIALVVLAGALALAGCSKTKSSSPTAPKALTRPYQLALVPRPAELNGASFEEALTFSGTHGDVIAHTFDAGVPWDSVLAGRMPMDIAADLVAWRDRTAALGCQSYAAISLLDAARDSLAGGWNGAARAPAIAAEPDFGNSSVRHALRWWCAAIVTRLQPVRCAVGVEINAYQPHTSAADWDSLRTLYASIYDTLKTLRPAMEVFPTWQLQALADDSQWGYMTAFSGRIDAIALSTYPALSTYQRLPSQFGSDYIARARTKSALGNLPLLVSETGYADSTYAPWNWPGSAKLQADYLHWLLAQADSLRIEQVTWAFPSDPWAAYDASPTALAAFHGPMGLRRRDLTVKPALAIWDSARTLGYAR